MRADTVAILEKYKISTLGNKKRIEKAEKRLWEGENVIYLSPTNMVIYSVNTKKKEKLPGIFIFTDKRALCYFNVGLSESFESFELSEIKSIDTLGNSLTGGHITIHTLTKTLEILVTYKKDVMQQIRDDMERALYAYREAGTKTFNENDVFDQIEKLHDLHEKGIITQEEFSAKKSQLLELGK